MTSPYVEVTMVTIPWMNGHHEFKSKTLLKCLMAVVLPTDTERIQELFTEPSTDKPEYPVKSRTFLIRLTCPALKVIMKNMFSLLSTYINWSSLSLLTLRMRKANKSCIYSAAQPTGQTVLLQAVQIQLLSLRNERRDVHRPASSARW